MRTSRINEIKKQVTVEPPKVPEGFQPQTENAYTTVSIIKQGQDWIMRQVDIVDGQIVKVIDTKPNSKSIVMEYLRRATYDLFAGAHLK